jgi:RyR domain-containing protein
MNDVEFVAGLAHAVNRAYCEVHGDFSNPTWEDTDEGVRASTISGVRAMLANPDLTPRGLHALWMKHKLENGWRFGVVKDVHNKTHPCIVPYAELPRIQQGKDALFHAVVTHALLHGGISHE